MVALASLTPTRSARVRPWLAYQSTRGIRRAMHAGAAAMA